MKNTILASLVTLILAPLAGAQCVGDIAVDSRVDGGDLGVLLANWGPVTSTALSHACDLDGNTIVNGADLGILLNAWGLCPTVVPSWATLIEAQPDPAVVTDPALRAAITATLLAWRVRDNGTGIEMLLMPPGNFQMGCVMGSDLYGCNGLSFPVHSVTLTNAFYLSRYETTQAQWHTVTGTTPSYFVASNGYPTLATRPVDSVSWDSVQGFLAATALRLPTEAEWEYACRAGTLTPFYNGSTQDSTAVDLAWFGSCCGGNSGGQTHAVGGKAPNALGLHDMLGNVWEWVADFAGPYPTQAQTNPVGPAGGYYHVQRGGCWLNDTNYGVNAAGREYEWSAGASWYSGFRVARNP